MSNSLNQTSSMGSAQPAPLSTWSTRPKPAGVSFRPSSAWDNEQAWSADELYVGGTRPSHATAPSRRRAIADVRGIFVAAASGVVLIAALLSWHSTGGSNAVATVGSRWTWSDYGYWTLHDVLPAVAALGLIGGVVNALLRPGERGALAVFVLLRVFLIVQLAAVIVSIVASASSFGDVGEINFPLLWPAWVALGGAIVALLGSLSAAMQPQ